MILHIPTLIARAAPIASHIGTILASAGVRPMPPENTVAMLVAAARVYVNCKPALEQDAFLRLATAAYQQALAERDAGGHGPIRTGPAS